MIALFGFVGRLLLALLFLVSGFNKVADISGTQQLLATAGLSATLAWPAALFEVVGGLALAFGVLTRLFAVLLAGFCLAAAFFFHNNFVDPMEATMLLKDVAIAGGLLCLCALSTARWSYDAMREKRRDELAARDAEVRAARAEGEAVGARAESEAAAMRTATGETIVHSDGTTERRNRWL